MSNAKITLQGFNAFMPSLFDGLVFPVGINKDTAVDEILIRAGEFPLLYTDPDYMKHAIEHWGKKHYRTFDKWVEALSKEFDPLYNYDRYEEYEDERLSNGNTKSTATNNQSNTIENTENGLTQNAEKAQNKENGSSLSQTDTVNSGGETNTRSVSAYDSATYQPREKEEKTNNSETDGSGFATNESTGESETNRTQSTAANSKQSAVSSGDASNDQISHNAENIKHTAHLYGNIGVTTSSTLLEEFLRVERFSIYEQIADIFVDEFCIMVY